MCIGLLSKNISFIGRKLPVAGVFLRCSNSVGWLYRALVGVGHRVPHITACEFEVAGLSVRLTLPRPDQHAFPLSCHHRVIRRPSIVTTGRSKQEGRVTQPIRVQAKRTSLVPIGYLVFHDVTIALMRRGE